MRPEAALSFDGFKGNAMPETWKCNNCRLVFPIGWFHFSPGSQPYWAATLLTCASCGTGHAVEFSNEKPQYKDRLFHLREPYFDDDEPEESLNSEGTVLTRKWFMGPQIVDQWFGGTHVELQGEDYSPLECAFCGSRSITDVWDETKACPACRGNMSIVCSWFT